MTVIGSHVVPRVETAGARGTVDKAAAHVTWAELGCPTEIGDYQLGRETVRVKQIHIIVAESDPAARFTVVVFRPPLGPPQVMLGHRVA